MIKKCEDVGIKRCNDPNAFIEFSNRMDDVYQNIDNYNPSRKRKTNMTNKHFQAIIKELLVRCRKLNISFLFISQSYFSVPTDVRLNSTHYLIMKINSRKELKNIAVNHSADIDYHNSMRICRECTIVKKIRFS